MNRRLAAACGSIACACLFSDFALAEPASDNFSPPVPATSYAMSFEAPAGGPLAFRGAVAVRPPFENFGGFSGSAMVGPRTVIMVSDRGVWVRLTLEIEGGRLIGVDDVSEAPMLSGGGDLMPRGALDAEGMTRDPETGRLYVSYEIYHRIYPYEAAGGSASGRILPLGWEAFPANGGVEGLALAPDGRFWAVRESPLDGGTDFPVYVGREHGVAWEEKRLPARGSHRPTGAEFGPEGWLYVTERAFSLIGGFRFRLRRLKWADGPDPVAEEELLNFGAETNIDNIESVTIWPDGEKTYLLILSDDNFFPVQRNVFALFEITG